MFSLFKRKQTTRTGKPKAIAFVDYEHWFISLDKLHRHQRPDIKGWRNELANRFELQEIIFFADFSNPTIRLEIPRIREVSNYIIETQNTSSSHKKDFTDFIMLDHIYQKAINSPEINTFILFSGDGHFNSVCNYLITQLGKQVGVYAIRGGMSNQLKNTASWVELLPKNVDPDLAVYRLILGNLRQLQDNKAKKSYPTFWATVEAVARQNTLKRRDVANALRYLIAQGCISQYEAKPEKGKTIKALTVDWKKAKILGVWE
jgi:uncharacterized LabA/DUF88 family protein